MVASLYLSLEDAVASATADFSENALVRVVLYTDHLSHPISTKCLKKSQMTPSYILANVMEHLQSCEEIPLDNSLRFDIIVLENPRGEGKGIKIIEPNNDAKLKHSIIVIQNNDSLCMARAIVVLMAKLRSDPSTKPSRICVVRCKRGKQKSSIILQQYLIVLLV